jgi:hypothetical protein
VIVDYDNEPIQTKKPKFIPKFASRKNRKKKNKIQIPINNNTGSSVKTKDLVIETPKLETPPMEIKSEFLSIKKNTLTESEVLTPMTTHKKHSTKTINIVHQEHHHPGSNMIKITNVKKKRNLYNPSSIINMSKKNKKSKKQNTHKIEAKKIKPLVPKQQFSDDKIKSFSNLNEKDLRKELRENNKRLLELSKHKSREEEKLNCEETNIEPKGENFYLKNKINQTVSKKIKALRPLIKESALDEPRIRHGKFIPHTENHKKLMRNLEQVRQSKPIFKPNMPGDTPVKKKSIDIETGNQPLQKSINEYIKNVSNFKTEEKEDEEEFEIKINQLSIEKQNVNHFHTGGSFEDFQQIENTLKNSIQTDKIHSILSSQNEVILSQKGKLFLY